MAVFGVVDALGGGAEDIDPFGVKAHGQIVGDLSPYAQYRAVGLFKVENVHHALEGQFVEVESVAHVVVRRDCLGVGGR